MTFPMVALGEIFDIARGGSPRPIENYLTDDPDGLNWVLIGDATRSGKYIRSTEKRIRPEGLKKSRAVEPGDFLLSNSMSFGRPYIMATHGCIHDGWLVLKNGSKHADPDYLYHLLGSKPVYREFVKRAPGTTVKNLNTEIVSETRIPLPPLVEQKRIAAILDEADAIRRKRSAMINALDRLELVVGASALTLTNGAAQTSLGAVCLPVKQWSPARECSEETFAYIDLGSIDQERKTIIEARRLTPSDAPSRARQRLKAGDVLVSTVRPYLNGVAIVPDDLDGATASTGFCVLRPDPALSDTRTIFAVVRSSQFVHGMVNQSTGASYPAVSDRIVKSFPIPKITVHEQRSLLEKLDGIRSVRSTLGKMGNADRLFASLQHRAFKGEL